MPDGGSATFDDYLVMVKKKIKINKNKMILTTEAGKSRATLSTDVLEMLTDLKGGDKVESDAADAFIDAWTARSAAKTDSERKKLTARLSEAFDGAIAQKSAKEGRTARDAYQKQTGFTTKEINDLVVDELAKKIRKLKTDTGIEEHWLPKLRQRVAKAYADGPKDGSDAADKRLKALKTMVAVEYAASTIDDLTRYNHEADKDAALGHLGTNLDKLVDDNPRVYVNSMVDGELVEDDGKLKLRLIVKEGFESAVTEADLKRAHEVSVKRLSDSALPLTGGFDVEDVTFDSGADTKKWRSKLHTQKAENDAIQKLADKRFPATVGSNRSRRFGKTKKSLAQTQRSSLLLALAKVLEQQEKTKARKQQQGKVGVH